MRRLLLTLILILFSSNSWAAIALLTHTTAGSANTNNVTTGAIDTTGANLLIAVCSYYATGTNSVSDSKTNTWTKLTEYTNGAFNRVVIFYSKNPTVGSSHTFTESGANGSYPSIAVASFSGADTTAPFDQQNGNGSSVSPGSITPGSDNEVVISGLSSFVGNNSFSIDSGFTITDQLAYSASAYLGVGLAYKIQTTAAAVSPAWTDGDTNKASDVSSFLAGAVSSSIKVINGLAHASVKTRDGLAIGSIKALKGLQ